MRNLDLTVVYYTSGRIKNSFGQWAREQLLKAAGKFPIVSVSQQPLDFGENICVGDIGHTYFNIYRQMLMGAKAVRTKYTALAEDDTLYSPEHFRQFRPKDDEFAYDMSRWTFLTWSQPPLYSLKYRISNSTMICPTELLIVALEERFAKYPDPADNLMSIWGEPSKYERQLGVTVRTAVQWMSTCPCIVLSHPDAIGYALLGMRKRHGQLKAYDIPYWGTAASILEKYQDAS